MSNANSRKAQGLLVDRSFPAPTHAHACTTRRRRRSVLIKSVLAEAPGSSKRRSMRRVQADRRAQATSGKSSVGHAITSELRRRRRERGRGTRLLLPPRPSVRPSVSRAPAASACVIKGGESTACAHSGINKVKVNRGVSITDILYHVTKKFYKVDTRLIQVITVCGYWMHSIWWPLGDVCLLVLEANPKSVFFQYRFQDSLHHWRSFLVDVDWNGGGE